MKKTLIILISLIIISCQENKKQSILDPQKNPFFQEWNTPYGIPPFNLIKDDHYMVAFQKGMEENLKEIDEIVSFFSSEKYRFLSSPMYF